jgi:peptidoglycan/LPS O-acetylase OafA/YrhL
MGERGHVAALDGVRGLAIGLVLVGHVWNSGPLAPLAPYGVTLFFLLSGYLITGLLSDELAATGRVRWGRFAVKRAARLLPAFAAMVTLVLALAAGAGLGLREMGRDALPGVLYVADFAHAPGSTLGAFGHTWSLSVEEQFYAVWPLLLWALWRLRRRLPVAVLVAVVVWAVAVHGVLPSGTSFGANVGYLAVGSLLAVLRVPPRLPRERPHCHRDCPGDRVGVDPVARAADPACRAAASGASCGPRT